jgi:hypothetical protein
MANEGLMALLEMKSYGAIENELVNASSAELYQLWQDAAYLKERARFLLADRHSVILP